MNSLLFDRGVRLAVMAVTCACAIALGGCVGVARPVPLHHYDLGAVTIPAMHATAAASAKVLRIARIETPEWLAGTSMRYRLRYRHDNRLAAYAYADWIAPPATLLEPVIQRTLAHSGTWRAVLGPDDAAMANASLRVRVDDFSQDFPQPHASVGVVDASATLIDDHDDRVIAQRHFHVEIATPTADARGGAKALGVASTQLATQMLHWLQDTQRRRGSSQPP